MKFSVKLVLWTMILMAFALGLSGFYFVNYVFETSLEREIGQALDENSILRFAFETAALNVPVKYGVLPNGTVEQIASNLETSGQDVRRLLRLSDEEKNTLYVSDGFDADSGLLEDAGENTRAYRVVLSGGKYYIQTRSRVSALDRRLYLETMKDVSGVFSERAMGYSVYRRITILMLALGVVIMLFIAAWLTKPIRLLTRATREMAAGDYGYRAKKVSGDELGDLTLDFNKMAGVLQENIQKLEEEIKAREDFVGAFAHELKTPLTSIIGYADMLRSRKLDEEKSFLSANYIYTEGKRLETMSLRLLDILVTKRGEAQLRRVSAESLFTYLQDMFMPFGCAKPEKDSGSGFPDDSQGYQFVYSYDRDFVFVDSDLIKTVLINLLDNACKASQQGGLIEVMGKRVRDGYRFAVRDYGVGIPKTEQARITEAFYMVDKSRSRSRNGAGLGLALCAEILSLHQSGLEIESEPGRGSCIGFVIPAGKEDTHEKADH